jgi:hypothetical protein
MWLNSSFEFWILAPSSSGPGRQVLILKIRGSTPLGVTTMNLTEVKLHLWLHFLFARQCHLCR